MCPYYDERYKSCNISGKYQENRERDCLSDYNWKRCANYEKSSLDTKLKCTVRPNPDL